MLSGTEGRDRSSFEPASAARESALELNEVRFDTSPDDLPLARAYQWERTRSRQIFLTQPVNGVVRNWNWGAAMNEARRMAAHLEAQNWPAESRILILSKNCAWWIMAEFAIWMSGHVTVPVYTSLTADSGRELMEHADPVACFVGPLDNPGLVSALPRGIHCIRFPIGTPCESLDWETIVANTEPITTDPERQADELATIIYTSGTTGSPKGAMHRFEAFPYFAKAVTQVTGPKRRRHRVISYLPLAHIAERALTETAALYEGWRIFFSESTTTFLEDLKRARPTVFFSVPRLYAKFQAGVLQKISQHKLDRLLRIPVVGYFVRRRILRQFGLQAVRFAASGSAAISLDLLLWFRKLGLPLTEGYGTTETGITHTARSGAWRPGRVGCSAPGVETKLSEIQEVLVKSPMNMLGYYHDEGATRVLFTEDGFVRTGDLGEIDGEGWLRLTGRIKEQFKTSKGKYVSPSTIEAMLGVHEAIESCLVMGAGLPSPFAIIVLSAAAFRGHREKLEESLVSLLESVNARLAPYERLKFLVLTKGSWSVESGFSTPTLKLKRSILEAHYRPFIAEWTNEDKQVFWHIPRADIA